MRSALALAALALLACAPAFADERPLSTDRPDRTESAYSVPRGRWQLELDVVSWGRHQVEHAVIPGPIVERTDALDVLPFNLKYGIGDRADLQLVVSPWSHTRIDHPAGDSEDAGSGDVTGRLKLNLWGNDGGRTALALMPYASVPTRGEERRRIGAYGVVTPFALDLGNDRALGAMLVVEKERGLDAWLGGSLTVSSPLRGDVGGFVELYVVRAGFDESAQSDATLDAGVTYGIGADLQLDAGVYRGLTDTTEDWRVFLGFAVRR